MARFDTSGLDDLIRDMTRMGERSGEIAHAMVDAGVEEIRECWRDSAEAHGHRDTGDMIASIGSGPFIDMNDIVAKDVYPLGKDHKGVRNAEKAFVLHYGTRRIPGSYWVDDADDKAAPRVQSRLEQIWADYLATGKIPTIATDKSGDGVTKVTK